MVVTTNSRYKVTDEQLAKSHRIFDEASNEVFYRVENSKGEVDAEGSVIEYTVRYTQEHGFTCTCEAGKNGFLYAPKRCWHVRAAVHHSQLYKQERKQIAEREAHIARLMDMGLTEAEARIAVAHQLIVDGKPADDETLVRVFGPRSRRPSEVEIELDAQRYQSRPFSLMR